MRPTIAIALVAAWLQAGAGPQILGPAAAEITSDDVAAFTRLAGNNEAPWIVFGFARGMIPARAAAIFFKPDTSHAGIRRGRVDEFIARQSAGTFGPWERVLTARYAQVPVERTNPDTLTSARDLNRPFRLVGVIDDDDILAVVRLIRSSPSVGMAKATVVQGGWPITQMILAGDELRVRLIDENAREMSGQFVALRRAGSEWAITSVNLWIAD